MGKIRRERTKFHASSNKKPKDVEIVDLDTPESTLQPVSYPSLSENPFSNIFISNSELSQTLDINNNEIAAPVNPDIKESKINAGQVKVHLNKKEKRKQRRENFLKKLSLTKISKEKEKSAKTRASVPVVGDLQPMTLALPTIEAIIGKNNEDKSRHSKKAKRRRKPKRLRGLNKDENFKTLDETGRKKIQSKRTQKHMLYEIHRFKKLLSDPDYKKNSMTMITGMIRDNAKVLEHK